MDGCTWYLIGYVFGKITILIINTLKYSAMMIVAIFMGPGKTIHRLAASNTERMTGVPWDVAIRVYKVEKVKVVLWMLWAIVFWGYFIYSSYMFSYGTP